MIGDQSINHVFEKFSVSLARDISAVLPLGIENDERRPRIDTKFPPDRHVRVIHDGMLDLVSQDRFADVGCFFFVVELGRMHANHDQFIRILLFEVREVRQNVHAVDAAERPEVDQHDLTSQILDRNRTGRIQPLHPTV